MSRLYTDSDAFWMVWNPAARAPVVRHMTQQQAEAEAMRLARINKGQRFFVLKATDFFVTDDVQHVRLDDPEMPF